MSEDPTGVREAPPTSREGALPCLQVLLDLRHLYIRVELFYFVEDVVLVIIAEVVKRLLLAPTR